MKLDTKIIKLNFLGVGAATVLAKQVVAQAKAEAEMLPALAKSARKVERLCKELEVARRVPTDERTIDPCEAHRDAVIAWAALRKAIEAWAMFDDAGAKKILAAIYARRTPISRLRHWEGWLEADTRLAIIGDHGLEDPIRALGAGFFLDRIRKAHAIAGHAFNLTSYENHAPEKPRVREPLDALRSALSDFGFLAIVQSLGDDRDRAAQAHRLLFPIVEFQASQRARRAKSRRTNLRRRETELRARVPNPLPSETEPTERVRNPLPHEIEPPDRVRNPSSASSESAERV